MSAKCSDMFNASLYEGSEYKGEYDGYVPEFFPGQHYGDYVTFNIDIETGRILNWVKPSVKDLAIFKKEME